MIRSYRRLLGLAIFALIFISTPALGENRHIQLALFAPVQIFPEDDTISGVRLNLLYGRDMRGYFGLQVFIQGGNNP